MSYTSANWAGVVPGTTGNADEDTSGVAGSSGFAWGTGAGQHGTVLGGSTGGSSGNMVTELWHWINAPIVSPMRPTTIGWIVFVVLFAWFFWAFVIYHIRIAAEAI
jgi:hypothetical protein